MGTNHVHILGDVGLSKNEKNILQRGLNFIPKQHHRDYNKSIKRELFRYGERIRWREFWKRKGKPPVFWIKREDPKPAPCDKTAAVDGYLLNVDANISRLFQHITPPNHDREFDWVGLESLIEKQIIIKQSDKNLGAVAISLAEYNSEVIKHLGDTSYYTRVDCVSS